MKFSINQDELSKSISIVQRSISSRTTLPILTGILLKAENNRLILSGTDLELGITTNIECNVETEGSIVITSRLFGEIIKKLPNTTVNLESETNNNLKITCNGSNFNILGQNPEEYPEIPSIKNDDSFFIEKELLKNMIRQTIFATSLDETRTILTGALLEIENNTASIVALDGYRLALKRVQINSNKNIKVVIPRKTLSELSKIIDENDDKIDVYITDNHIIFKIGRTTMTSRLLEGQFLNYEDIIREDYKTLLTMNTKDFSESLDRASLLAREGKNNLVKLKIFEKKVEITSKSDFGDVLENVDSVVEGDEIEIAFNSKYLLDGIKVIDSSKIEIKLMGSVNPCIIKSKEDPNYTYLVLPVRLS